jgi:hypothetical protein
MQQIGDQAIKAVLLVIVNFRSKNKQPHSHRSLTDDDHGDHPCDALSQMVLG